MKKITYITMAIAAFAMASCGNPSPAEQGQVDTTAVNVDSTGILIDSGAVTANDSTCVECAEITDGAQVK